MKARLFALILFGLSFAFVESSVVFYLRKFLGYDSFNQINYQIIANFGFIAFVKFKESFFRDPQIAAAEVTREFATIIMLFAVAYLTANTLRRRIGAFLIAFAIWDLFYYVFLRLLINWPRNLFDTDIFFLIPIPWIGPVITPLVIAAALLIIGLVFFLEINYKRFFRD